MDSWLETKSFPLSLVSASGFVFKEDKILLIKDKKRGWSFPGGVSDKGEAILDCLKREIYEESSIVIEPRKLVGVYQRLKGKPGYGPLEGVELPPVIVLTFICDYLDGKESISEESEDVCWVTIDKAKELIDEPYVRLTLNDLIDFDGDIFFRSFDSMEDIKDKYGIK